MTLTLCHSTDNTIDPTLLSAPVEDWDDIIPNAAWERDNRSGCSREESESDFDNNPLLVSGMDDALAELQASGPQTPQTEKSESYVTN